MERDPRDDRDWPDGDPSAAGTAPSGSPDPVSDPRLDAGSTDGPDATQAYTTPAAAQGSSFVARPASAGREESAPAEIESWPSQDAADHSAATGGGWSSDTDTTRDVEAWPTEPPTAGSASPDAWPTAAPERGRDVVLEPTASTLEPPPSEVEAYPAGQSDEATLGAAAASAHSVPAAESATGESTQCPRCGTENRPGLAFCRNCGQRLVAAGIASTVTRPGAPEGTQACPRCGTHNRAGVAFCQNCGANLRGTAASYVPPAVAVEGADTTTVAADRHGAVLGPIVLLIGTIGIITAYLLPFAYGPGSLFERGFGPSGYGAAFWNGYPDVGASVPDQAYFGLAAPAPMLAVLLVGLAIAGFARAVPGMLQRIGLGVALLWALGLVLLFLIVELAGNWDGDLVGLLRVLTPAGIIFFLSSLIVIIGVLTRFGRS